MISFLVISIFSHSISSFAAGRPKDLLACANRIASTRGAVARVGPDAVVVPTFDRGWSLLAVERGASFRCSVPRAIEACFRANPNCRAFDFLLARPAPGVRVGFDGTSIDDGEWVERVTRVEKLTRGTVDERGLVRRVISGGANPTLGLNCVADASAAVTAVLERALGRVIAERDQSEILPAECETVAPVKASPSRNGSVPAPENAFPRVGGDPGAAR